MSALRIERSTLLAAALGAAALSGCNARPVAAASSPAASAQATPERAPHRHHRELELPPVGPQVSVLFEGQRVDITLSDLAHGAATIPLLELWRAALPNRDPASLTFDLFGSDGFHPSDRAPCGAPLTPELIAAAHIDVTSHDISFDPGRRVPGCYRVHAVVRFEGRLSSAR